MLETPTPSLLTTLGDPLVGTLVNIVGIVVALVVPVAGYLWNRRPKHALSSVQRSQYVIGDSSPPGPRIRVLFDGKPVPRVTQSWVTIWNSGHAIVGSELMVEHDQLRIQLDQGAELLDSQLSVSRANMVLEPAHGASEYGAAIALDFDFFERGDAVQICTLHTGKDVSVKGSFRGIAAVRDETQSLWRGRRAVRLVSRIVIATWLMVVLFTLGPLTAPLWTRVPCISPPSPPPVNEFAIGVPEFNGLCWFGLVPEIAVLVGFVGALYLLTPLLALVVSIEAVFWWIRPKSDLIAGTIPPPYGKYRVSRGRFARL